MKFPRTPHLPGSKGTSDDIMLSSFHLDGEVVATEKMDGSNIMLTNEAFLGRSGKTPRGDWTYPVRDLWENIRWDIPEDYIIAAELLTWRKCISYTDLPGDIMVFSVISDGVVLPFDEVVDIAEMLNLPVVPVVARGEMQDVVERSMNWMDTNKEGFVVRPSGSFPVNNYGKMVAKFVGSHHTPVETNNGKNTIIS